jgi:hypothetical protein
MLATVTAARATIARTALRFARRAGSPAVRQNMRSLARAVRPCRMCPTSAATMAAVTVAMMIFTADAFTLTIVPPVVIEPVETPAQPATIGGTLPATKSHKNRSWLFTPSTDRTQPGIGIVTITQSRETDCYGVDVVDGTVLFAKADDEADVYGVSLTNGSPRCTCRGFAKVKHCKHADTTLAMVRAGVVSTVG